MQVPAVHGGKIPVLFLRKHVADRVQHNDVITGAEVVLEHVSGANADLRCDAGVLDVFGGQRHHLGNVEDLALHVRRSFRERDGVGTGAATKIKDAANTGGPKGIHYKLGAILGDALHAGDEVARPFARIVAIDGNAGTAAHSVGHGAPAVPDVGAVQQTVALVVFGTLDKVARGLGRVLIIVAALAE